ncbi:MAG: hypothetical protein M1115_06165 [Actinobacteria bacterium]|nr:hypothetical protein [Actinomycetota bacterium]
MIQHAGTTPVKTEGGEAWIMKNCIVPVDLQYDVDRDFWARHDKSSGVTIIGITDIGQTASGKLQAVSFPRASERLGHLVPAGKTVAMFESAKWVGALHLPVESVLKEVNTELVEHPLWVNLEPYGNGWVAAFQLRSPLPWITGEQARQAYQARLQRTFRSVRGVEDDFWCVHCNDWNDL